MIPVSFAHVASSSALRVTGRVIVGVCDDGRRSNRLIASLPEDVLVVTRTSDDFATAPHPPALAVIIDAAAHSTSLDAALHRLRAAQPTAATVCFALQPRHRYRRLLSSGAPKGPKA
jgi:hypothetical protein